MRKKSFKDRRTEERKAKGIGCEKDRARRITTKEPKEEKKSSSETEGHEKQHLATLKRLKRGDQNELEGKTKT